MGFTNHTTPSPKLWRPAQLKKENTLRICIALGSQDPSARLDNWIDVCPWIAAALPPNWDPGYFPCLWANLGGTRQVKVLPAIRVCQLTPLRPEQRWKEHMSIGQFILLWTWFWILSGRGKGCTFLCNSLKKICREHGEIRKAVQSNGYKYPKIKTGLSVFAEAMEKEAHFFLAKVPIRSLWNIYRMENNRSRAQDTADREVSALSWELVFQKNVFCTYTSLKRN